MLDVARTVRMLEKGEQCEKVGLRVYHWLRGVLDYWLTLLLRMCCEGAHLRGAVWASVVMARVRGRWPPPPGLPVKRPLPGDP